MNAYFQKGSIHFGQFNILNVLEFLYGHLP